MCVLSRYYRCKTEMVLIEFSEKNWSSQLLEILLFQMVLEGKK